MRTGWLTGAWVDVLDGKPDPTFSLVGMVTEQAKYDREGCTVLLHELPLSLLTQIAAALSFRWRFRAPGLTLEWSAFSSHYTVLNEAAEVHLLFTGPPCIREADERWTEFLRAYNLDCPS